MRNRTLRQARTYEERVRAAVRSLWSRGLYPSPAAINDAIGRNSKSNLGGRGPEFRRYEMRALGIPLQRSPRKSGALRPKADGEEGWLIEYPGFVRTVWWTADKVSPWTTIASEAVRFSRKRDAEAIVRRIGFAEEHLIQVVVTEHRWPA